MADASKIIEAAKKAKDELAARKGEYWARKVAFISIFRLLTSELYKDGAEERLLDAMSTLLAKDVVADLVERFPNYSATELTQDADAFTKAVFGAS